MKLTHSWGPAAQIGVDWFFFKNWLFNLDVKYISISTEVSLKGLINQTTAFRMDPWVFGAGFGYKW